jgi:hypothetical protein
MESVRRKVGRLCESDDFDKAGKMLEKYEQGSVSVGVNWNWNEGVRVGRGGNEARSLYWGKGARVEGWKGGEWYGCGW